MNLKMIICGAILVSTSMLSGCSILSNLVDPEWSITGKGRVTQAGVVQNIDPELEKVDLIRLLDPTSNSTKSPGEKNGGGTSSSDAGESSAKLYKAYERFNELRRGAVERNQIQDEILRASEQRCSVYKTYIRRTQSGSTFFFGSLATILGGLGAIFTDATVARSLAGSAGILSGIGAEYQQSYFSNLATEVIVDGIEMRRQRIRDDLMLRRQNADIRAYTVQAAILDAVRFHGACTIVEGLREASQSIQTTRDPGLKAIKSSLRDIAESRKMLDQIQKGEYLSVSPAGLTALDQGFQGYWNEGSMYSPTVSIHMARTSATVYKESLMKTISGKKTEFNGITPVLNALDSMEKEISSAYNRLNCKLSAYEKCDKAKEISSTLAADTGQLQMMTTDRTKQAEIQKNIMKLQSLAKFHILIDLEDTMIRFRDLMKVSEDGISVLKAKDADPAKSIGDIQGKITAFMNGAPDGADVTKCDSSCP